MQYTIEFNVAYEPVKPEDMSRHYEITLPPCAGPDQELTQVAFSADEVGNIIAHYFDTLVEEDYLEEEEEDEEDEDEDEDEDDD
jgi:hypothetical protein